MPKKLFNNQQLQAPDFALWPDQGELKALIPLKDWQQIANPPADAGVLIAGDAAEENLQDINPGYSWLAIQVPAFTDGRAYSLARRIRRTGYKGRLVAVGDIVVDQTSALLRCGFDEVELDTDYLPEDWHQVLVPVKQYYQADADSLPIWQQVTR